MLAGIPGASGEQPQPTLLEEGTEVALGINTDSSGPRGSHPPLHSCLTLGPTLWVIGPYSASQPCCEVLPQVQINSDLRNSATQLLFEQN